MPFPSPYRQIPTSPLAAPHLFAQRGDQCVVESRNVIRISAGDQLAVDHGRIFDDIRTRIAKVGPDRWPARHRPTAKHVRLDEKPRPMADCGNRLVGIDESANDPTAFSSMRSRSGLPTPPGRSSASYSQTFDLAQRHVRLDRLARLVMHGPKDFLSVDRGQRYLRSLVDQALARNEQLALLEAVRCNDEDVTTISLDMGFSCFAARWN